MVSANCHHYCSLLPGACKLVPLTTSYVYLKDQFKLITLTSMMYLVLNTGRYDMSQAIFKGSSYSLVQGLKFCQLGPAGSYNFCNQFQRTTIALCHHVHRPMTFCVDPYIRYQPHMLSVDPHACRLGFV